MRRLLLIIAVPSLLFGLVLLWGPRDRAAGSRPAVDGRSPSPAKPSSADVQASRSGRSPGDDGSASSRATGGADAPGKEDPDSALGGDAEGAAIAGSHGEASSGATSAASSTASPPPSLDELSPTVRAQVRRLKQQGADPRLRTASDGSTFVELGGPALFVPVATIDEDGNIQITEH